MIRTVAVSIFAGTLLATSAFAHDDGITEKVRHLGISIGKTYACHSEEDRAEARADAEEMFDRIYVVDGHELAFVFAVGVGYGAASEKIDANCAELLPLVKAVKADMGLGGAD